MSEERESTIKFTPVNMTDRDKKPELPIIKNKPGDHKSIEEWIEEMRKKTGTKHRFDECPP